MITAAIAEEAAANLRRATEMRLRDHFATHAPLCHPKTQSEYGFTASGYAEWAYDYADAMLAARKREIRK